MGNQSSYSLGNEQATIFNKIETRVRGFARIERENLKRRQSDPNLPKLNRKELSLTNTPLPSPNNSKKLFFKSNHDKSQDFINNLLFKVSKLKRSSSVPETEQSKFENKLINCLSPRPKPTALNQPPPITSPKPKKITKKQDKKQPPDITPHVALDKLMIAIAKKKIKFDLPKLEEEDDESLSSQFTESQDGLPLETSEKDISEPDDVIDDLVVATEPFETRSRTNVVLSLARCRSNALSSVTETKEEIETVEDNAITSNDKDFFEAQTALRKKIMNKTKTKKFKKKLKKLKTLTRSRTITSNDLKHASEVIEYDGIDYTSTKLNLTSLFHKDDSPTITKSISLPRNLKISFNTNDFDMIEGMDLTNETQTNEGR